MINRDRVQSIQAAQDYTYRRKIKILNAKLGNNSGTVEITGTDFWWIRLHSDANQVVRARLVHDLEPTANLDVSVQLIARTGVPYYQVLGRAVFFYPDDPYTNIVGGHHEQHERQDGGEGGTDPVDVFPRMIAPLRAHEQDTPDMTVRVDAGEGAIGSTHLLWLGGNSPTFTAPTNFRKFDLLYLGADNALHIQTGTEASGWALPPKTALATSGIPICWILLSPSTTTITESIIYDAGMLRGAVGSSTVNSSDVLIPVIGTPTYNTEEELQTLTCSSGVLDATVTYITQADATHINVAAGKGLLRISNSPLAQLKSIEWAASNNIAIPAGSGGVDSVRFVGVEYNAGSPQVTVRTSFNWNWNDDFPLGRVSQDGTTLRIINTYAHAEDTANLARRFNRLTMPFVREEPPEGTGGLMISAVTSGGNSQYIAMSAGNVWHGFNRYVLSAVDTSGAGRFDSHYRNGTGGFTAVTNQQQWNNTQYDNGSGLSTLTANHYGNHWVYVDISDGSLDLVFGRGDYTTSANAQAETAPSDIPGHLQYHGRLLGRIIFKKSDTSPTLVQNVFDSTLNLITGSGGGVSGSGTAGKLVQFTAGTTIGDATNTDTDVADAVTKRHDKQHAITATADHTSSATPGQILKADANGLPVDASNTDAEVADAVSKKHTQGTDTALGTLGTKNPPIDADLVVQRDSASAFALVTSTWAQVKAFLKTYFDTIYAALTHATQHKSGGGDAIKLDELATPTDVTTLNANTSVHGLLLKAVAPETTLLNVVGIGVGETAYTLKALVDNTDPAALGTAAPGTQLVAARRDHVHPTELVVYRARVYNSSNITLSNATWTRLAMNSERYVTAPMHFTSAANLTGTVAKNGTTAIVGTGTSFTTELTVGQVISVPGTATEYRVVTVITDNTHLTVSTAFVNTASGQTATRVNSALVAPVDGVYGIGGSVQFDANTTGYRALAPWINNFTTASSGTRPCLYTLSPTGSGAGTAFPFYTEYYFNQWDFVEIAGYQSSTGNLDISAASALSPEFTLRYISP